MRVLIYSFLVCLSFLSLYGQSVPSESFVPGSHLSKDANGFLVMVKPCLDPLGRSFQDHTGFKIVLDSGAAQDTSLAWQKAKKADLDMATTILWKYPAADGTIVVSSPAYKTTSNQEGTTSGPISVMSYPAAWVFCESGGCSLDFYMIVPDYDIKRGGYPVTYTRICNMGLKSAANPSGITHYMETGYAIPIDD